MIRTVLSGLAAAAALTAGATQWCGVAAAARNTKPQEIVVVGSKVPSAGVSRRKGAPLRSRAGPSKAKGGLLMQQGRPTLDADSNESR
jgi:hypothetical protein